MTIKKFNEFLKINELNSETYRSYADKVGKFSKKSKRKAIESAINVEYFGNPNYKPKPFSIKYKDLHFDDIGEYPHLYKTITDAIEPRSYNPVLKPTNWRGGLSKEQLDKWIKDSSNIHIYFDKNEISLNAINLGTEEYNEIFRVRGLKNIQYAENIRINSVEWDGDDYLNVDFDTQTLLQFPSINVNSKNGEIDISPLIERFECNDIELLLHNIFYGIVHDTDLMEGFDKNNVSVFHLYEDMPCIHFKGYENVEFLKPLDGFKTESNDIIKIRKKSDNLINFNVNGKDNEVKFEDNVLLFDLEDEYLPFYRFKNRREANKFFKKVKDIIGDFKLNHNIRAFIKDY